LAAGLGSLTKAAIELLPADEAARESGTATVKFAAGFDEVFRSEESR
jgi:hypothetical protein